MASCDGTFSILSISDPMAPNTPNVSESPSGSSPTSRYISLPRDDGPSLTRTTISEVAPGVEAF